MHKKQKKNKPKIYLILDNIRSTHNVGSIFRTADGAGVEKIFICGYTPLPIDVKVQKTALGAEKYVQWESHKQIWKLIKNLKKDNINIVSLEQTPKSKNIYRHKTKYPMALIVGNEIKGVGKSALNLSNDIIEIPMQGKKESLNVSVATGIALYILKK